MTGIQFSPYLMNIDGVSLSSNSSLQGKDLKDFAQLIKASIAEGKCKIIYLNLSDLNTAALGENLLQKIAENDEWVRILIEAGNHKNNKLDNIVLSHTPISEELNNALPDIFDEAIEGEYQESEISENDGPGSLGNSPHHSDFEQLSNQSNHSQSY